MFLLSRVFQDVWRTAWYGYLGTNFVLIGVQLASLGFGYLRIAQPLIGFMGDLFGLEAFRGMKLHLEGLAAIAIAPLGVDSFVLGIVPRVLQSYQLESLILHLFYISLYSACIFGVVILKRVSHSVVHGRYDLVHVCVGVGC